jgi:hemerythrin-like domain-containing protein
MRTEQAPAAALQREHREIDEGIERFLAEPASEQAAAALSTAVAGLRRHIYLEEEVLFPPLSTGGLVAPVFVMLREHAEIWQTLDALDRELPAAGNDPVATLELCRRLLAQLQDHNLKEERVLYPQADQVLPAAAVDRLAELLNTAALPDGWVCVNAR